MCLFPYYTITRNFLLCVRYRAQCRLGCTARSMPASRRPSFGSRQLSYSINSYMPAAVPHRIDCLLYTFGRSSFSSCMSLSCRFFIRLLGIALYRKLYIYVVAVRHGCVGRRALGPALVLLHRLFCNGWMPAQPPVLLVLLVNTARFREA